MPTLEGSSQCRSSTTTTRGPVAHQAVDVAGGDIEQGGRELGRVEGMSCDLDLPAGERGVSSDRRDGPAEAPRLERVHLFSEEQASVSAPESTPCSSAMVCAKSRA